MTAEPRSALGVDALVERLVGAVAFDDRWSGRGRRRHLALLAGPCGSGRRAAAHRVAAALGGAPRALDVAHVWRTRHSVRIDVLREVIESAEAAGAILVLERADALFGGRAELLAGPDGAAFAAFERALIELLEEFGGVAVLIAESAAGSSARLARDLESIVEFAPRDDR